MAKRMSQSATDGGISGGSNISPETIVEYGNRIAKAKREARAAGSFVQAEVKRAKSAGVPTDALQKFLKDREKDPDVVKADQQAYARCAAAYGVVASLGQPSLDLPGPTEKTLHQIILADADLAGHQAGRSGAARDSNPHQAGSEMHVAWDASWLDGQMSLAREMGENSVKVDGRKKKSGNPEDRPAP